MIWNQHLKGRQGSAPSSVNVAWRANSHGWNLPLLRWRAAAISRHKQFEHIYRHHRRYRITEGAEEIQMSRVAGYLFGFMGQQAPKGVDSTQG